MIFRLVTRKLSEILHLRSETDIHRYMSKQLLSHLNYPKACGTYTGYVYHVWYRPIDQHDSVFLKTKWCIYERSYQSHKSSRDFKYIHLATIFLMITTHYLYAAISMPGEHIAARPGPHATGPLTLVYTER